MLQVFNQSITLNTNIPRNARFETVHSHRACLRQLGTKRSLWLCLISLLAALLGASCDSVANGAENAAKSAKPKLTVVVVLDQLPSWVLDMYLGQLEVDGAIRTTLAKGTFHHRVVYDYATTYTSPGHSAIFTGAPPAYSGVDGNRRWSPETAARHSIVEDGVHPVFGVAGATAGPRHVKAENVADILKSQSKASRVVALSLKDRGAVVPAGVRPDIAIWYDPKARGFTTSNYYAPEVPRWLVKWQQAHPAHAQFQKWNALDKDRWALAAGNDKGPGEDDRLRLGVEFPHQISRATDPYTALLYTPYSTLWLLQLAREAVAEISLCTDASADLLSISISSTDYVGHAFGPNSWEALDNLVRVDAALGEFLRELEQKCTLSVVITSDHGAAPLPEVSVQNGREAYRLYAVDLLEKAEKALDQQLGGGNWISGVGDAFFYFSTEAADPKVRAKAIQIVRQTLTKIPGVHSVIDVREARRWITTNDPLKRSMALGLAPDSEADFWVIPKPFSVLMDSREGGGGGTTHGTPWYYDTDVPVLMSGPRVNHVESREPLRQCRVASTIASLLGVRAPKQACPEPLPGLSGLSGKPHR